MTSTPVAAREWVDPLERLLGTHQLETDARIDPLLRTALEVDLRRGLAVVTVTRTFRNDEDQPIEALLTFPVPSAAVLFRLRAEVRSLRIPTDPAAASDRLRLFPHREIAALRFRHESVAKRGAEETYYDALDEGVVAVLHEELLPGIHLLSVSSLRAGQEMEVSGTWTMPLGAQGGSGRLRIPNTIGQGVALGGIDAASRPRTDALPQTARLRVSCETGAVRVNGAPVALGPDSPTAELEVETDAPVDLEVRGAKPGSLTGRAADGRTVTLEIEPARGDGKANAAVLVDRSRSMDGPCAADAPLTKWEAAMEALRGLSGDLAEEDRLELWEFDNRAYRIGPPAAAGGRRPESDFGRAVARLAPPHRSTEIGRVLASVIQASEAPDLLVITDGKSRGLDAESFLRSGRRLFVALVGEDSLDGALARLAVQSGGDYFVAAGTEIGAALRAAMVGLRAARRGMDRGPEEGEPLRRVEAVETVRGGARVAASWSEGPPPDSAEETPGVAALAASLALEGLPEAAARRLAIAEGIASPFTDLALVDESGERQPEFSIQRRGALPPPRTAAFEPGFAETQRPQVLHSPRHLALQPRPDPLDHDHRFGPWASLREVAEEEASGPADTGKAGLFSVEGVPSEAAPEAESSSEAEGPRFPVDEIRFRIVPGFDAPSAEEKTEDRTAAESHLRRDAFFPVRVETARLPNGTPAPGQRAVVEEDGNRVIAIVSDRPRQKRRAPSLFGFEESPTRPARVYRLITNEEACDAAGRIFAAVFGEPAARAMRPLNLTMPAARTFMHADFGADSLRFETGGGDLWTPFLRVTNSYNQAHRLRFTVGLYRPARAIGWIIGDGVTFSDPQRRSLEKWVETLERDPGLRFGSGFAGEAARKSLDHLAEVPAPRPRFLAGLARALDLSPPPGLDRLAEAPPRERKRLAQLAPVQHWRRVGRYLLGLSDRYLDADGENAYALLGAAAEYASRLKAPGMSIGRFHALQRRCGGLAAALGRSGAVFEPADSELAAARRIEIAVEYGDETTGGDRPHRSRRRPT